MSLAIESPYLRLIRFDKPIGSLLLLWPTLWALLIAGNGSVSLKHFIIFTIGVFLMRSAGCVINDLADRNFDGYVERTASRPLARKELSVKAAITFLITLLTLSASLLFFLNSYCFYLALSSAALTVFYPFCKRFFFLPQLVLSVTFSFGVLIGFAAVLNELPVSAYLLYLLTACWIFMFDTIYALVDQEDDEQLLLFSSAISLGKNTKTTIYALMGLTQLLWLLIAHQLKLDGFFCIGWLLGSCCFLYQVMLISNDTRESYFKAFLNNNWYGLVILLSLLVGLQQHW